MAEYGLSLDEALDIPDATAADLLKHATRRRFLDNENLATLIQAKVGELLSGKPAKYKRPFEDDLEYKKEEETPMTQRDIVKLEGLTSL